MSTSRTKVFLDSSVLLAGLASGSGASHVVLTLAEAGIITACISEQVVLEVMRNVEKKLPAFAGHFHALFKVIPFWLTDPAGEDLRLALTLINQKDTPILAAAMSAKSDWLLTLDKHFFAIVPGMLPLAIGTPGLFLKEAAFLPGKE